MSLLRSNGGGERWRDTAWSTEGGATGGRSPGAGVGRPHEAPAVIAAIDGMAGIGKSALAIQAAHQLADAFPDGQLYVGMRGATPGTLPQRGEGSSDGGRQNRSTAS